MPLKPHVGQQLQSSFPLNISSAQATFEEAVIVLDFCFLNAPDQMEWSSLSDHNSQSRWEEAAKTPDNAQTRYVSACSTEREIKTWARAISVPLSHLVLISLTKWHAGDRVSGLWFWDFKLLLCSSFPFYSFFFGYLFHEGWSCPNSFSSSHNVRSLRQEEASSKKEIASIMGQGPAMAIS